MLNRLDTESLIRASVLQFSQHNVNDIIFRATAAFGHHLSKVCYKYVSIEEYYNTAVHW